MDDDNDGNFIFVSNFQLSTSAETNRGDMGCSILDKKCQLRRIVHSMSILSCVIFGRPFFLSA